MIPQLRGLASGCRRQNTISNYQCTAKNQDRRDQFWLGVRDNQRNLRHISSSLSACEGKRRRCWARNKTTKATQLQSGSSNNNDGIGKLQTRLGVQQDQGLTTGFPISTQLHSIFWAKTYARGNGEQQHPHRVMQSISHTSFAGDYRHKTSAAAPWLNSTWVPWRLRCAALSLSLYGSHTSGPDSYVVA